MRRIGLAHWVRGACLAAALARCAPLPSSPEPTAFGPATPSVTIELPPPALRVAQTTPAEGDTLRLDGTIRVRFNRPTRPLLRRSGALARLPYTLPEMYSIGPAALVRVGPGT
jgi:hypothetical protein